MKGGRNRKTQNHVIGLALVGCECYVGEGGREGMGMGEGEGEECTIAEEGEGEGEKSQGGETESE